MIRRIDPPNETIDDVAASPRRRKQRALPVGVQAAVAVMQMGFSDYAEIAAAVGLTDEEVRRIDMAEDAKVRQLAIDGVPPGKQFRLVRPLRCPKCRQRITIAPCIVCDGQTHYADERSSDS